MKVRVRLFASYRELAGKNELSLELAEPASVASLKQSLEQVFPQLQEHDPLIAVNGTYAEPDRLLEESDEIALLPPFSGG